MGYQAFSSAILVNMPAVAQYRADAVSIDTALVLVYYYHYYQYNNSILYLLGVFQK